MSEMIRKNTRVRSIRSLINRAAVLWIVLFLVLFLSELSYMYRLSAQYDRITDNLLISGKLDDEIRVRLTGELRDLVTGRKQVGDSAAAELLETIDAQFERLESNAHSRESADRLQIAVRSMRTLKGYSDDIHARLEKGASVSQNQRLLAESSELSLLITDMLREFSHAEGESAQRIGSIVRRNTVLAVGAFLLLLVSAVSVMLLMFRRLDEAIREPIRNLDIMTGKIAEGSFQTRVEMPEIEELQHLTGSFNSMAEHVETLMEASVEEQKKIQKAEMRALQAQITPHFLYNTFDTIIWLAEEKRTEEIVDITMAFSRFFRISLSRGRDWIAIDQEKEHIRTYLVIQQYRYADALRYSIDIDPEIGSLRILKLVLQPLVENSIHHGMNRRGAGISISVTGRRRDDGKLEFVVSDNGSGMTQERLRTIRGIISTDTYAGKESYGLYNVNRRLRLYYTGAEFEIDSVEQVGTTVRLTLPDVGEA